MTHFIKSTTQFIVQLAIGVLLLSASQSSIAQCDIDNLEVLFHCDNEELFLSYSFTYPDSWPDNESYRLFVNGQQYGAQHTLADLAAGPDQVLALSEFEGQTVSVGVGVWPYTQDCIITEDNIVVPECIYCQVIDLAAAHYCIGNTGYIYVEFGAEDFTNDFFDYSVGDITGYAEVGEGWYNIPNVDLAPGIYELSVSENDNPNCVSTIEVSVSSCGEVDCDIEILVADAYCTSSDVLYISLEFEATGFVSENFDYSVGTLSGTLPLETLTGSYQIPAPGLDPGNYVITISESGNSDPACDAFEELYVPSCTDEFCTISNLTAEPIGCEDGSYSVLIDFDYANIPPNISQFTIEASYDNYSTTEDFGSWNFADAPILLTGFTADQMIDSFGVYAQGDCQDYVQFEEPNCGGNDCSINNLFAEVYCEGDAVFLDFEFDAVNFENAFFDYNLGGVTGFAETGETFYTIENIDLSPGTYQLVVSENDNPSCSSAINVLIPDCPLNEDDCQVALSALGVCDGEVYYVDIVWTGVNLPTVNPDWEFNIVGNATTYGTFPIGQTEVTLGPFTYDQIINEFGVNLIENGVVQCQGDTSFAPPECGEFGPCTIANLSAEVLCEDDGTFVIIDFEHYNVPDNTQFELNTNAGDSPSLGLFNYGDQPLVVGPFTGDLSNTQWWVSNSVLNDWCQNEVVLENGDCEPSGPCEVFNVTAESLGCEDGSYSVIVDFDIENIPPGSTQFGINGNGTQYGTWNYADAPIILGPFTTDQTINEFAVFDTSEGNDCQSYAEFEAPSCDEEEAVTVSIEGCDEEYIFLQVNVDGWIQPNAGNFSVAIMPDNFEDGPFPITEDGIGIDVPFTGTECTIWQVTVINEDNPGQNETISLTVCPCTQGDVWPGDNNNDGVANNFDFLNIGLAYGNQGIPRAQQDINWYGHFAASWVQNFFSGLNFKYSDADGNGVINGEDALAIDQNYDSTHAKTEGEEGTEDEAPLYVDLPDTPLSPGEEVSFPIVFGSSTNPVANAYAFAFSIEYDPEILLDPQIVFNESWLGDENINALSFVKHFPSEGRFEVAFTRNNQINTSGFGTVGYLASILIENVEGYQPTQAMAIEVDISNVEVINASEAEVPFSLTPESAVLTTGIQDGDYELNVYPNPANDQITVQLPTLSNTAQISLLNSMGQVMRSESAAKDQMQIDLNGLSSGVYFIEIVDQETRIIKKIDVVR